MTSWLYCSAGRDAVNAGHCGHAITFLTLIRGVVVLLITQQRLLQDLRSPHHTNRKLYRGGRVHLRHSGLQVSK